MRNSSTRGGRRQSLLRLVLVLVSVALCLLQSTAELTESDILASERAWADTARKSLRHGFSQSDDVLVPRRSTDDFEGSSSFREASSNKVRVPSREELDHYDHSELSDYEDKSSMLLQQDADDAITDESGLTEQDIINREREWAATARKYFEHGFARSDDLLVRVVDYEEYRAAAAKIQDADDAFTPAPNVVVPTDDYDYHTSRNHKDKPKQRPSNLRGPRAYSLR